MPRADHLQLRLMEGVEQAVDLRAGQAEHGVDAMRDEAIDDRFAAGSCSHCMIHSLTVQASSATPFFSTPTPSASTSMTSPGFR